MGIKNIIDGLLPLLPEFEALVGHSELAPLTKLLQDEVKRRMIATGWTRAEVLADAAATFAEARKANEDLKKLGHEAEG